MLSPYVSNIPEDTATLFKHNKLPRYLELEISLTYTSATVVSPTEGVKQKYGENQISVSIHGFAIGFANYNYNLSKQFLSLL